MSILDMPPHTIDIYLPLAPTQDYGGGVQLNWADTPDQSSCPCIINTTSSGQMMMLGQNQVRTGNVIGILSSALSVTLVRGTKLVATDTGRTFILQGLRSPNRQAGNIPPISYIDAMEMI